MPSQIRYLCRISFAVATFAAIAIAIALPSVPDKDEVPAQLDSTAIEGFENLSAGRRDLVSFALATGRKHGWLQYQFGSADPSNGGFDCSGAMYYVLRSVGYEPPRTSAQQYRWLVDSDRFVAVTATALSDEIFSNLLPGDLLFWSGTYDPTDGRKEAITHVQMYLGVEKETGTHLMIGASDGRTYRGKKQNGYGVFEFRLPSAKSTSRFVGYGTLLGID